MPHLIKNNVAVGNGNVMLTIALYSTITNLVISPEKPSIAISMEKEANVIGWSRFYAVNNEPAVSTHC